MNLKLDQATSQRRDDVIRIVFAGFALFVCEFILVKWIFAKPPNQRELVDYLYVVFLAAPFQIGLGLRRRVKTLQSTNEMSVKASAQINSDVSFLVLTTYGLLMGLWIIHSLVK